MSSKQKFGIGVMAIGMIMLLNTLPMISIDFMDIIFKYWPILLIYKAVDDMYNHNRWTKGNYLLLGFGLFVLVRNLGFLGGLSFKYIWPFIVIYVGYNMFYSQGRISTQEGEDFNVTAFFSGQERRNTTDDFKSASVTAMFGGCDIDLTEAKMMNQNEGNLSVTVLFGGAEVKVPKEWNVNVSGTPLFGGMDNTTVYSKDNGKTLKVDMFVMFGGLELKN